MGPTAAANGWAETVLLLVPFALAEDHHIFGTVARVGFLPSLLMLLLAFQFHLKKFIWLNSYPLEKIQK
jgi:hypothetical protein